MPFVAISVLQQSEIFLYLVGAVFLSSSPIWTPQRQPLTFAVCWWQLRGKRASPWLLQGSQGGVAQWLEHRAYISAVPGSNPGAPTTYLLCFCYERP